MQAKTAHECMCDHKKDYTGFAVCINVNVAVGNRYTTVKMHLATQINVRRKSQCGIYETLTQKNHVRRGFFAMQTGLLKTGFWPKRSRVYKTMIKEQKRLHMCAMSRQVRACIAKQRKLFSRKRYMMRVKEAFRIHYDLNAMCNFRLISLKVQLICM